MAILPARRRARLVGDVCLIPLTRGRVATVDARDADLGELNWCALGPTEYAVQRRSRRLRYLHIVVAKRAGIWTRGSQIDHRNRDRLDCRRGNLRAASSSQNHLNSCIGSHNTSGVKGVGWSAQKGKWRVRAMVGGREFHGGFFASLEEAARARRRLARARFGAFAWTGEGRRWHR